MSWIAKTIEHWPITKLAPYERNARVHSEQQLQHIAASISEFGFTTPILVGSDGVVIAGHGRLEAAKRLGMVKVPVVVIDHLTDAQRRALVIADNRIAELASWDRDALKIELDDLKEYDIDLDALGLDFDLRDITVSLDDKSDSRKPPDMQHDPIDPTPSKDQPITYPIVVNLSRSYYKALKNQAKALNMSAEDMARRAIEAELDANGGVS